MVIACNNAAKRSPRGSSWPSSTCQVWKVFPAQHSAQVLSEGGHAKRLLCYIALCRPVHKPCTKAVQRWLPWTFCLSVGAATSWRPT